MNEEPALKVNRLFDALVRAGWVWREGDLVAPNGTMWLDGKQPWQGDVRSFHARMVGRVGRLRGNLAGCAGADAADIERAVVDAQELAVALEMLL